MKPTLRQLCGGHIIFDVVNYIRTWKYEWINLLTFGKKSFLIKDTYGIQAEQSCLQKIPQRNCHNSLKFGGNSEQNKKLQNNSVSWKDQKISPKVSLLDEIVYTSIVYICRL